MIKKIISLICIVCLLFAFTSCKKKDEKSNKDIKQTTQTVTVKEKSKNAVKIPNVIGVDEETAKTLLINLGLVPNIKYEYCGFINKGQVNEVLPKEETSVEKGSVVDVIVSKGFISATANYFSGNLSCSDNYVYDGWQCNSANIEYGVLYATVTLNDVQFYDNNIEFDIKTISCAFLEDNKSKVVPVQTSTSVSPGSKGSEYYNLTINLTIPIEEFNVGEPDMLNVKLIYHQNYSQSDTQQETLNFKFNFGWEDTSINHMTIRGDHYYDDFN